MRRPNLLVLDVIAVTQDLLTQMTRLRADKYAVGVKIFIRSDTIDEGALIALYERDIEEIAPGEMSSKKLVDRFRGLFAANTGALPPSPARLLRRKFDIKAPRPECPTVVAEHYASLCEQFGTRFVFNGAAEGAVAESAWGLMQVAPDKLGIYVVQVYGARLTAQATNNRLHGLLRSEGMPRHDPAATLTALQAQIKPFLTPGLTLRPVYVLFDQSRRQAVCAGASEATLFLKSGGTSGPEALSLKGSDLAIDGGALFHNRLAPADEGAELCVLIQRPGLKQTPRRPVGVEVFAAIP